MLRSLSISVLCVLAAGCENAGGPAAGAAVGEVPAEPGLMVSRPSEWTVEALRKVDGPVEVLTFFAPGPARDQVFGYFGELAARSGRSLPIREVDPLDPEAAQHKAPERTILLVNGDRTARIRARPSAESLRTLDGDVLDAMIELVVSPRRVHLLGGDARVVGLLMESVGLTLTVVAPTATPAPPPADAVMIFIDDGTWEAPRALALVDAHLARGGCALVAVDPERTTDLGPLGARLGLRLEPGILTDDQHHVRGAGPAGPAVHRAIATSQIAIHPTTARVSRAGASAALVFLGAAALANEPPVAGLDRTFIIRSMPSSFRDLDGDARPGAGEPRGSHPVAAAVSGARLRAVVFADAGWLGAPVLTQLPAAAGTVVDVVAWLLVGRLLADDRLQIGTSKAPPPVELTSYPLRRQGADPALTSTDPIWRVDRGAVRQVLYASRTGQRVSIYRSQDRFWGRFERGGAPAREVPLSADLAGKLVDELAAPVPIRRLGPPAGRDRSAYGLGEATLSVDAGGGPHQLTLGSRVFGGGDRYAADAGGRVYVLPGRLMAALETAERVMVVTRAVEYPVGGVKALRVRFRQQTADILRAPDGQWYRQGTALDRDRAYAVDAIVDTLPQLRVQFAAGPAPDPAALEPVAELHVQVAGGQRLALELFRAPGEHPEYLVRTDLTVRPAQISAPAAERLIDAIARL